MRCGVADQLHRKPAVLIAVHVFQKRRRRIHVRNDSVYMPVAVEVGQSEAACAYRGTQSAVRCRSDTLELYRLGCGRPDVSEKQYLLCKARSPLKGVDDRIEVTVADDDVLPPVVVEIEKCRSP